MTKNKKLEIRKLRFYKNNYANSMRLEPKAYILRARCSKCKEWVSGFNELQKHNYFEIGMNAFYCNGCNASIQNVPAML